MEALVGNLLKAYEVSIKDLDWMSETTKTEALKKLSKFSTKIGYPDQWRDYSALRIAADDLFGNMERAAMAEYGRQLARQGGPVDRSEWGMNPQTVNAYYMPPLNEIVSPAAILQPPFFDLNADDAVNYGAIGAVIGHEIGHGFDDKGSTFDGDGVMRNWWTAEDRAEFESRTGQLVAQYNSYQPFDDLSVNGEFTLGGEHRRSGFITLVFGLPIVSRRRDAPGYRWLHRASARIPWLWPDLAEQVSPGGAAATHHDRSPFPFEIPGQWRRAERAGVLRGLCRVAGGCPLSAAGSAGENLVGTKKPAKAGFFV